MTQPGRCSYLTGAQIDALKWSYERARLARYDYQRLIVKYGISKSLALKYATGRAGKNPKPV